VLPLWNEKMQMIHIWGSDVGTCLYADFMSCSMQRPAMFWSLGFCSAGRAPGAEVAACAGMPGVGGGVISYLGLRCGCACGARARTARHHVGFYVQHDIVLVLPSCPLWYYEDPFSPLVDVVVR